MEIALDTLDSSMVKNRATMGAVKDPKTIENIQLGPYGAVRTPMKLIITDNATSAAHDFGVRTLFASSVIFFHYYKFVHYSFSLFIYKINRPNSIKDTLYSITLLCKSLINLSMLVYNTELSGEEKLLR
ncbi:MAG: hypothetical protein QXQ02_04025 [Halobacteria archaeon]